MSEYTIVNLVGDISKYIGEFFGFIGEIFKSFFVFFYNSIELIVSIFGINNLVAKLIISGLYMLILSLIPDLITFFTCRISKKYRVLKTKEEKREYRASHTHFLLKAILMFKSKIVSAKSSRLSKKNNRKKKKEKTDKKLRRKNDILVDDVVDNLTDISINDNSIIPVNNNIQGVDSNESINELNVVHSNEITDFPMPSNKITDIIDEKDKEKNKIKVLYSSNIIGKMIRKGVILERKLLVDERPILIDFSDKPREVFTNHLCDEQSGIKFRKMVNGNKVEMFLDNPDLLSNPKLYDDLSKEELEELKERLSKDANYQIALRNFFLTNDKALTYKKS